MGGRPIRKRASDATRRKLRISKIGRLCRNTGFVSATQLIDGAHQIVAALLTTDLHAGTFTRAKRDVWLVIAPTPFVGDPWLRCDPAPFELLSKIIIQMPPGPSTVSRIYSAWITKRIRLPGP